MQKVELINSIKVLKSQGHINAIQSIIDDLNDVIVIAKQIMGDSGDSVQTLDEPQVINEASYSEYDGYSHKLTQAEKFWFVLNTEKRFMKFREAAEIIMKLEGTPNEGRVLKKITQGLTNACSGMKKSGKIQKYQDGGSQSNTYWGLKSWLSEDGGIKPKYLFKKEIEEGLFS